MLTGQMLTEQLFTGQMLAALSNKKAQLTPGLRATALSFQDGVSSKMAVNHHLGYYQTGNDAIRSPIPKTLA